MLDNFKSYSYVEQDGIWLVQLPSGKYKVNEEGFTISGYKGESVTMPVNSVVFRITAQGSQAVEYKNPETLETLSPSEYNTLQRKYQGTYDEDLDEYYWSSLEEEFECRKKLAELSKYEPVRESLPDKEEPVALECIGTLEDTGSKFITTPVSVGSSYFQGGFYKLDATGVAVAEANKLAEKYKDVIKFENRSHSSYLRFAQINGSYVFGENYPYTPSNTRVYKTLEEAKQEEANIKRQVLNIFVPYITSKTVEDLPLADIIKELNTIQTMVGKLDVKVKSQYSKKSLFNAVKKLTQDIVEVTGEGVQ